MGDLSSRTLFHKLTHLRKHSVLHSNKKCVALIDEARKCIHCHQKMCTKCALPGIELDGVEYECNECGQREEEKALFGAIESSLVGMRSNVIQIIFEYSMGVAVRCCNEWNCVEEIHFASRFLMEVNAQQNIIKNNEDIFQYFIHRKQTTNIHPSVELFGKKRRIFCKDCTENELETCILCGARVDVGGVNNTSKCQKCCDIEYAQKKQT